MNKLFVSFGVLGLTLVGACGGSGGGDHGATCPAGATLSLSPKPQAVSAGGSSVTFYAGLNGCSEMVTWTLTGPGTLSANQGTPVVYTPPSSLATATTATVTIGAGGLTDSATFTVNPGGGSGLGTLGGTSFAPAETGALVIPPTTCIQGATSMHFSGLLLGFSSYTGLCSFVQTHGALCADKASATLASVDILKGNAAQTPSAVGPGDYPATGNPYTDQDGNAVVAESTYSKTNGTCASTGSDSSGGSIHIATVTATNVTGTLNNVVFGDGSNLNGTFNAAICNYSLNLCDFLNDTCTTPVCVP